MDAVIANQTTALMKASHLGEAAVVKALILAGAELNARNADGNNALWLACVSNDLDTLNALIAAGIHIDNCNDNDATCLMYAASTGKSAVVAKLIEAGAALSPVTLDGFTALDMAANLECLQLLLKAERSSKKAAKPC
jgi:thiosulfate/3-mercaptopyruvate sulfurtransferase